MKNAIIFLAGAAAGTGVTYYFLRKYYNDQMESTIQEIQQDYRERAEQVERDAHTTHHHCSNNETEERSDEHEGVEENYIRPGKNAKVKPRTQESYIDYSGLSKEGIISEDSEESEDASRDISVKTVPPKGRKRFCISPDEFIELDGREKVTLTYFEEDQVFMTDTEETYLNGLKDIGKSNLDQIANYPDGTLYVRNLDNGTDYEIIFEDGSYADYIEGKV